MKRYFRIIDDAYSTDDETIYLVVEEDSGGIYGVNDITLATVFNSEDDSIYLQNFGMESYFLIDWLPEDQQMNLNSQPKLLE